MSDVTDQSTGRSSALRPLIVILLISSVAGYFFWVRFVDEEDASEPTESETQPVEPPVRDLTDLDERIADLTDPGEFDRIELSVSSPHYVDACHEIFEPDGEPVDWDFDDAEAARLTFGCDVTGHIAFDDGRRVVAYEVPIEGADRATDLRVVFYDADGSVRWHQRMDRSREVERFTANHRHSFLTSVDDRLICAGTSWLAGTQLFCVRTESGRVTFEDRLGFWAGTHVFGFDGSLFAADLAGITRRYPFRGTEMRHREYDRETGRDTLYATDEHRIFVGSSEATREVTAWNLADLGVAWRAEFSDAPLGDYSVSSPEHELLFLIVDGVLVGLDARDGQLRMAFFVDTARPRVAFSDHTVYLLVRIDADTPALYAVDPDDGSVHWVSEAPAGSLELDYAADQLLTRSVRTVRVLEPSDDPTGPTAE